jgi:hypothetical protein
MNGCGALPKPIALSIAQLGHRIGLHVSINLEGRNVGGVFHPEEEWVTGEVVGGGALGNSVSVKLDTPIGGGEPHGFLGRRSGGVGMVSIDDPGKVRALDVPGEDGDAAVDEVAELVKQGRNREAIARYRELNGATLAEARAFIEKL